VNLQGQPIELDLPRNLPPGAAEGVETLARDLDALTERAASLKDIAGPGAVSALSERAREFGEVVGLFPQSGLTRLEIFHGYFPVFIIAFMVTLLATPIMRRLALAYGMIDRPSEARKVHRIPVAYLGGVAVFLGLLCGILYSYLAPVYPPLLTFHPTQYLEEGGLNHAVPLSIVFGMTLIVVVGVLDDAWGIPPRMKVAGQLVAAAALAATDVGVKVAAGVLMPIGALLGNTDLVYQISMPFTEGTLQIDLIYWAGTAVIAVFVLGACNAANLIDGLDGLLSGTSAIAAGGLLVIAMTLALNDHGPLDTPRIILCLALLGACLGFLPHNFNPATIFLGDCGSLLLGFTTIVIILSLGDRGQTHLVVAGLIIFAIPIIDTVLAIVRRKMAGKSISEADDQHLHHMLKRALGVKGAVFALYGIGAAFTGLGIALSLGRARVVYAITAVFAAFIVVTAIKIARRKQIEEQAARSVARIAGKTVGRPVPASHAAERQAELVGAAAGESGPAVP
jgi:UDP-GlcNAc:undecaprenyl-phosphate/decaprenyl-phosphate GlcNAc-1-phosphate transferase